MPLTKSSTANVSNLETELLFLIARYLSCGPCKDSSSALIQELETKQLLPKGYDWEGKVRHLSFNQLVSRFSHVGPNYLPQMCQQFVRMLSEDLQHPFICLSYLNCHISSLLKQHCGVFAPRQSFRDIFACHGGAFHLLPDNIACPNTVNSVWARLTGGHCKRSASLSTSVFSKLSLQGRRLGHTASVYCVAYDRTGQYIFTGGDDKLIKLWHAHSGRLLASLRGHTAEISDMAVNFENTMLASGSIDKTVRIWCLRTTANKAVLQGHSGEITTLQFSPYCHKDHRLLMSTGNDGSVCFWSWSVNTGCFICKPKKFIERSRPGTKVLCSAFSAGGVFAATGHTDSVIRVYLLTGSEPCKIGELESHTVTSVVYSNFSFRFVTGSEDGTACVWRYESQVWKSLTLSMEISLDSNGSEVLPIESHIGKELGVSMVCWSQDDSRIITADKDLAIKVWDSTSGTLLHVLKGHDDDIFVLDPCPVDKRVILSTGHDGQIILWDIYHGSKVHCFYNSIPGQDARSIFDCRFSPSGLGFAATDSYGHILIFSFGQNEEIKKVPYEVYFHTDYRALIYDAHGFVLDAETNIAPHLLPPPFLVNEYGSPYPPALQRLVPGREHMADDRLMPPVRVVDEDDSFAEQLPVVAIAVGNANNGPVNNREMSVRMERHHSTSHHSRHHQFHRQRFNGGSRHDDDSGGNDGADTTEDEENVNEGDGNVLGEAGGNNTGSSDVVQDNFDIRNRIDNSLHASSMLAGVPQANWLPSLEGHGFNRLPGEDGRLPHYRFQCQNAASVLHGSVRHVAVKPINDAVLKTSELLRLHLANEETCKFFTERKKRQSVPSTPSTLFGNMLRGQQKQPISLKLRKQGNESTARNRLTTRALYDTEEDEDESEPVVPESDDSSSDWTMGEKVEAAPVRRRSQRKPKRRRISSSEADDDNIDGDHQNDESDNGDDVDDEDNFEERRTRLRRRKKIRYEERTTEDLGVSKKEGKGKVSCSSSKCAVSTPSVLKQTSSKLSSNQLQRRKRIGVSQEDMSSIKHLREEFRPPEWLIGTIPRKAPYVPQIGDKVMYFRQGHEAYLRTVERRQIYDLGHSFHLPWVKNANLREMELTRIISIHYEVKPPRLCTVKLAYICPDTGKSPGGSFTVRYHDMPDVIDFMVLKQHFDNAYNINWKPGQRFRSMIDDQWWIGTVNNQSPLCEAFPDSLFQSFIVQWDNGEYERLSPWDMEPISDNMMPSSIGGGVPVDPEELKDLLYIPEDHEWSPAGRDADTQRILAGLDVIMSHAVAKPFNAPVDLTAFPVYAVIIEYPIDLSTVKARLENCYYRRLSSLRWDVRHIEKNARKFNEDGTLISSCASILTSTLLQLINDLECLDPSSILKQLCKGKVFTWCNDQDDGGCSPGISARLVTCSISKSMPRSQRLATQSGARAWTQSCAGLLTRLLESEDAEPFMEHVDANIYPNYYSLIDKPMDLNHISCSLSQGKYLTPLMFAGDVRLIFSNSKVFNTNKRSKIISMTHRLSIMFEELFQPILIGWHLSNKNRQSQDTAGPSTLPSTSIVRPCQSLSSNREYHQTSLNEGYCTRLANTRSLPFRRPLIGSSRNTRSQVSCQPERRDRLRRLAADKVKQMTVDSGAETTDSDELILPHHQLHHPKDYDNGTRRKDSVNNGDLEDSVADSDKENTFTDDDDDTDVDGGRNAGYVKSSRQRRGTSGVVPTTNGCHSSYRTRARARWLRSQRHPSAALEEDVSPANTSQQSTSRLSLDSSALGKSDETYDTSSRNTDTSDTVYASTLMVCNRRRLKRRRSSRNRKRNRQRVLSEDEIVGLRGRRDSGCTGNTDVNDFSPVNGSQRISRRRTTRGQNAIGSRKRTTRNQGKRTCNYYMDKSEDDFELDSTRMSVSCRGRLRKLTRRACVAGIAD